MINLEVGKKTQLIQNLGLRGDIAQPYVDY
jgi:hypothetical protein